MASESILKTLEKPDGDEFGKYYSLPALNDPRIDKLPYSIKILLESAIRNCDEFQVKSKDVDKIIDWENTSPKQVEITFKPARVLLQDFTGVPVVVDLACMSDAMNRLGSDSNKINPHRCRIRIGYVLLHAASLLQVKDMLNGFFSPYMYMRKYLKLTGRSDDIVSMIEAYLRANKIFVDYSEPQIERAYSSYLDLNLQDVEPCLSGPKRPHDRVLLSEKKIDWHSCLGNKVGFKVEGIVPHQLHFRATFKTVAYA